MEEIIEKTLKNFSGIEIYVDVVSNREVEDNQFINNILKKIKNDLCNYDSIIFTDEDNNKYEIRVLKKVEEYLTYYYKVQILKYKYNKESKSKNKNEKNIYIKNEIRKCVNTLGITNAQILHSENEYEESFISLREYLKTNPNIFDKEKLFTINNVGEYASYRHKNLFSTYKDEISDFEKYTYMQRDEKKNLLITHKLDDNILDYEQKELLLERKNARSFAKEVYHKKGIFKDKELLNLVKGQEIFIKVSKELKKENKEVYSKIDVDDMNINILKKNTIKFLKTKPEREKNVQKNYLSKRNKKRKLRRLNKKMTVEEYYYLK